MCLRVCYEKSGTALGHVPCGVPRVCYDKPGDVGPGTSPEAGVVMVKGEGTYSSKELLRAAGVAPSAYAHSNVVAWHGTDGAYGRTTH
eukprot:2450232-Rhodomonas_salina.5